jgi:MFS family permease
MEKKKYLDDLAEIKKIMGKSTQFMSLSGLSGVLAGIYALIGAFIAQQLIENHYSRFIIIESWTFKMIILIALSVFVLSILTALLFSYFKTKKSSDKLWNPVSKRLLINFLIPLLTGGIFSVLLINQGVYGLIGPVTLIFYGLACVNASKYTIRDIRYLGVTEIIVGLIATAYPGNSLYFWAFGFGVLHIIYGAIMYFKYDKK